MFSTVDSLISWFQFNFFIKYFLLTIFPMKKSLDQHTDRPNPTLLGIFHDENGFGKNIFKIYYSMFLKKCLAMTKSSLFILIQLLLCACLHFQKLFSFFTFTRTYSKSLKQRIDPPFWDFLNVGTSTSMLMLVRCELFD